jgi:hypothetical protein
VLDFPLCIAEPPHGLGESTTNRLLGTPGVEGVLEICAALLSPWETMKVLRLARALSESFAGGLMGAMFSEVLKDITATS